MSLTDEGRRRNGRIYETSKAIDCRSKYYSRAGEVLSAASVFVSLMSHASAFSTDRPPNPSTPPQLSESLTFTQSPTSLRDSTSTLIAHSTPSYKTCRFTAHEDICTVLCALISPSYCVASRAGRPFGLFDSTFAATSQQPRRTYLTPPLHPAAWSLGKERHRSQDGKRPSKNCGR